MSASLKSDNEAEAGKHRLLAGLCDSSALAGGACNLLSDLIPLPWTVLFFLFRTPCQL